jgi:N-ethylmaleimide reductase
MIARRNSTRLARTPKPNLFDPLRLGPYLLPHRILMAPLTRGRADADGTPTEIMAAYYEQRASAGLIVSEATAVSRTAVGWHLAPGIFTARQAQAWKPVTDAVHRAGGRIFMQLWHTGRVSHPDFLGGARPVAPSAIRVAGGIRTPYGKKPFVTPRALEAHELAEITADFARAARRAIDAGFDGVEIHAANGFLLDQFIRDGANRRTDEFGGSLEGRWRFPLQVTRAVIDEIGASRTGLRVSPTGAYNGMRDSDPVASFSYGARELDQLGIAYLHVIEDAIRPDAPIVHPHLRAAFNQVLILNGGFDAATGQEALASGAADAIAYGVPFIANPDLPTRFRTDAKLNAPDPDTFYTPGVRGYTDYPSVDSRSVTRIQTCPSC